MFDGDRVRYCYAIMFPRRMRRVPFRARVTIIYKYARPLAAAADLYRAVFMSFSCTRGGAPLRVDEPRRCLYTVSGVARFRVFFFLFFTSPPPFTFYPERGRVGGTTPRSILPYFGENLFLAVFSPAAHHTYARLYFYIPPPARDLYSRRA